MKMKNIDTKQDQQTRQDLMDAGIALIAEKGYDGASIEDIAAHAEVTKGAVYYHFGSKENFVLEIIRQRAERNIAAFKARDKRSISLAEWIESAFSTIIGFANPVQQQFSLQVMMAGMRPGHERIAALVAELHAEWRSLIADMVRQSEEFRRGQIYGDPEVIAVAIMALIDGLLIHSRLEPETFSDKAFIEHLAPLLKLWVLQTPSQN